MCSPEECQALEHELNIQSILQAQIDKVGNYMLN
jgi:hypothetical protein